MLAPPSSPSPYLQDHLFFHETVSQGGLKEVVTLNLFRLGRLAQLKDADLRDLHTGISIFANGFQCLP
jgi:hypothetical protein